MLHANVLRTFTSTLDAFLVSRMPAGSLISCCKLHSKSSMYDCMGLSRFSSLALRCRPLPCHGSDRQSEFVSGLLIPVTPHQGVMGVSFGNAVQVCALPLRPRTPMQICIPVRPITRRERHFRDRRSQSGRRRGLRRRRRLSLRACVAPRTLAATLASVAPSAASALATTIAVARLIISSPHHIITTSPHRLIASPRRRHPLLHHQRARKYAGTVVRFARLCVGSSD